MHHAYLCLFYCDLPLAKAKEASGTNAPGFPEVFVLSCNCCSGGGDPDLEAKRAGAALVQKHFNRLRPTPRTA
jgi:hypothetical protein